MHELALAEALVKQAEEIVKRENASAISVVTVAIGALSGVERDAFEFAFPFAAEETVLAGAELRITAVPAKVRCQKCQVETEPELPFLQCEKCNSSEVEITGGKDFILETLEIKPCV